MNQQNVVADKRKPFTVEYSGKLLQNRLPYGTERAVENGISTVKAVKIIGHIRLSDIARLVDIYHAVTVAIRNVNARDTSSDQLNSAGKVRFTVAARIGQDHVGRDNADRHAYIGA